MPGGSGADGQGARLSSDHVVHCDSCFSAGVAARIRKESDFLNYGKNCRGTQKILYPDTCVGTDARTCEIMNWIHRTAGCIACTG